MKISPKLLVDARSIESTRSCDPKTSRSNPPAVESEISVFVYRRVLLSPRKFIPLKRHIYSSPENLHCVYIVLVTYANVQRNPGPRR